MQESWLLRTISQNFIIFLCTLEGAGISYEHLEYLGSSDSQNIQPLEFSPLSGFTHSLSSLSEKKISDMIVLVRERNRRVYRDLQAAYDWEIEFQGWHLPRQMIFILEKYPYLPLKPQSKLMKMNAFNFGSWQRNYKWIMAMKLLVTSKEAKSNWNGWS